MMPNCLYTLAAAVLLPVGAAAGVVSGLVPTGPFGEQQGEVRLHGARLTIVAPAVEDWSTTRPTHLILYALPNGNTTEQTMGRRPAEGLHWRYDIQHVAAQVRAFRALDPARQHVVVYLEADNRSWPTWRRENEPATGERLREILAAATAPFESTAHTITLTGHSGGGSLTFGLIEAYDAIPPAITRIAFLDSNYAFLMEKHGTKFDAWLAADPSHHLVVMCYDDRYVELDGKRIVSDTGGTWRATERMMAGIAAASALAESTLGAYRHFSGPQVDIVMHPNPELRILHTVMVGEDNGLMFALARRTPAAGAVPMPAPPRLYGDFIAD